MLIHEEKDSIEYKITCFNGKVDFITVCTGIIHDSYDKRTNDSYDLDFNHTPWYASCKNSTRPIYKPKQWEELIKFAEIFAKDIPYLRVDCYVIDDQVTFGEFTFYTGLVLLILPQKSGMIFWGKGVALME